MEIRAWHRFDSRCCSSRWLAATVASVATLLTAAGLGCGLAAAPQPPSLHIPKPVRDLKAARTGNQVALTWTMPSKTTDGLKLKSPIPVRICLQTTSRVCDTVGNMQALPGKPATFTHLLPESLTQGSLRIITYQVFTQNTRAQAAAASNDAPALAGIAPLPITGLTAQVVPQGVLLHWQPASLQRGTVFEIQRTLLRAPAPAPAKNLLSLSQKTSQKSPQKTPKKNSAVKKPVPPVVETLIVNIPIARIPTASPAGTAGTTPQPSPLVQIRQTDPGFALDTSVQWNATYRYAVARVVEYPVTHPVGMETLRIHGQPSLPIQLQTLDTFPPATPQGLAAVVVSAAMNGGAPAVNLSWSANTEPDFAQYRVYRREMSLRNVSSTAPMQIAPTPGSAPGVLLVTPAFQDTFVAPGHRYAYSVRAVDTSGNASAPSPEVVADIPTQ